MHVKGTCISNDPRTLADHQQSRAAAFESVYPLTPGKSYPIVGMTIAERAFYLLVPDDWGGPCFAPAGFFELFTAALPSGWRVGLEAGIYESGRDLWSHPGVASWGYREFVDDADHVRALVEMEPQALTIFQAHVAQADD